MKTTNDDSPLIKDLQNRQKQSKNLTNLFLRLFLRFALLAADEDLVDVWDNTGRCDGDVGKKLIELLIVPDGKHDVTRGDSGLLVVTSSISGKFENFDGQIFEDGSKEDWSTSTDTLSVTTFTEESVETTYWELETGTAGPGLWM